MACNPFEGLFGQSLQDLHKQIIDSTFNGLTVECTLHYSSTKYEECENCIFDPIGGKSSNKYKTGGPIPFSHGMCPYCHGEGKRIITEDELVYLQPIWNSKDWYNVNINIAEIDVQTMSKIETYPQIKRATSITIDNTIKNYGVPDFIRVGDPEPIGLYQSSHIITSWRRK